MISQFTNRQGFEKSLSGVKGTSIQSAYTKPIIAESLQPANLSWLPYPYGPLPETGPWSGKGSENEKQEQPTPGEPAPGAQGGIPESPDGNVLMFLAVVGAAWFLVYYRG